MVSAISPASNRPARAMRGKSEDELARKFMVQFCFEPLRCRRCLEVEGAEVCQQQCGSARVVAPFGVTAGSAAAPQTPERVRTSRSIPVAAPPSSPD